ncbi:uncharacterized protein LOC127860603 isoform X1 [Dreissena polymorpha]|uniref:Mitochondria-eating protein C-terminal domain-containing protein n=1 Tax=Dreissena polymorpha TaxID=45954 RepID=A0A9D4S8N6_DREPO|nr:uncharacterized protein LOC127860603 isoform X1 [Dreissena polymorpha]XP_052254736.1 uncharacterized protein LOC127860603 isoform X1 [Dreissena polymorpha]XP_052254747.1 uncharacterized protein LOC127860603 isoform X1 [Dreissena polymorpha]XP_052254757.1 uncharacterized protein LOC127860603 isoform X1 [Dreissena polymorpha]XP_052254766.1 uncharacterized protein LOC127860603 isoform X1 [Dreissena polymorpha]KAH3893777.1 hypothetical protein DPMN_017928 [Dreissena polymorpha]
MVSCVTDLIQSCLRYFEKRERFSLCSNGSDDSLIYPKHNPIRVQPTGRLHQKERSNREKSERCKYHEEHISQLRSAASNHEVEIKQLEEDNKLLQERCSSLEENIRKLCSDASNYKVRIKQCEEDKKLLQDKCYSHEEHISKLYSDANNYKVKNIQLEEHKKLLQDKVDVLYLNASKSIAKSGHLENTNDKYSNTRLAERFDGKVKDSWLDICDLLNDVLTEWERVQALSRIIKNISTKCTEKADTDIQGITCSSEVDEMEMNTLMDIRRRCGQTESKMEAVVKEMADSVWSTEDVLIITEANPTEETIQSLRNFIHDVIKICWLMAISQPPLMLNFEVEGTMYTPHVKERFTEYSTEDAVESNYKPGTILLVVWPSVEKRNQSGFLKKGEVIVKP